MGFKPLTTSDYRDLDKVISLPTSCLSAGVIIVTEQADKPDTSANAIRIFLIDYLLVC